MRIKCPNCGAQYEVPDQVIPADGRDVQCSNCGNTWFQAHPDQITPVEDDGDLVGHPETDEIPEHSADTDRDGDDDTSDDDDLGEDDEDEDNAPDTQSAPPPRTPSTRPRSLDPEVSDILREEAEHEARLREAEAATGLETQSELGLNGASDDEPTRRAREARDRMSRMRGEDPDEEDQPDVAPRPRSRLLPDIDDVSTTIKTEDATAAMQAGADMAIPEPPARRGGFGRGFSLIILLGVILVLLYVNAGKISDTVPAASGTIDSYVAQVDRLRVWLDSQLGGFIPQ